MKHEVATTMVLFLSVMAAATTGGALDDADGSGLPRPVFTDDPWVEQTTRNLTYTTAGGIEVAVLYYRHNPAFTAEYKEQQYDLFVQQALKDRAAGDTRPVSVIVQAYWDEWQSYLANRRPPWEVVNARKETVDHVLTRADALDALRQDSIIWERRIAEEGQPARERYEAWLERQQRYIEGIPEGGIRQQMEVAYLEGESAVSSLNVAKVLDGDACSDARVMDVDDPNDANGGGSGMGPGTTPRGDGLVDKDPSWDPAPTCTTG